MFRAAHVHVHVYRSVFLPLHHRRCSRSFPAAAAAALRLDRRRSPRCRGSSSLHGQHNRRRRFSRRGFRLGSGGRSSGGTTAYGRGRSAVHPTAIATAAAAAAAAASASPSLPLPPRRRRRPCTFLPVTAAAAAAAAATATAAVTGLTPTGPPSTRALGGLRGGVGAFLRTPRPSSSSSSACPRRRRLEEGAAAAAAAVDGVGSARLVLLVLLNMLLRPPRYHEGLAGGYLRQVPRALHQALGVRQDPSLFHPEKRRPALQGLLPRVPEALVRGRRALPAVAAAAAAAGVVSRVSERATATRRPMDGGTCAVRLTSACACACAGGGGAHGGRGCAGLW